MSRAVLVLSDGSIFEGAHFGAEGETCAEVVFDTSMVGYQEMLTDPSFAGQILVLTYPLIGNYGINQADFESARVWAQGIVVREACDLPSHYRSSDTLDRFLVEHGIPGLRGVDTRAIVRRLRSAGVMMGMITSDKTTAQALNELEKVRSYDTVDFVSEVTSSKPWEWPAVREDGSLHVVAVDFGMKNSILRVLSSRGCHISVVPATVNAEDVLRLRPDGVLLSPGPGNPDLVEQHVELVRRLVGHQPMLGICLGNQLLARAFGARNFKLKFGHHGGNQPVQELDTGRVYITAQNHGYAVNPDTIGNDLEVTHLNMNDGTVEGLRHRGYPIIGIQYHAEASPGPQDSIYVFDMFIRMMKDF